jgi:hypothetical protein
MVCPVDVLYSYSRRKQKLLNSERQTNFMKSAKLQNVANQSPQLKKPKSKNHPSQNTGSVKHPSNKLTIAALLFVLLGGAIFELVRMFF